MKHTPPTAFKYYQRSTPSNGNRTVVRARLPPTTVPDLIEASASATPSNEQATRGMGYDIVVYVESDEWSADDTFDLPPYTSIWTPD